MDAEAKIIVHRAMGRMNATSGVQNRLQVRRLVKTA